MRLSFMTSRRPLLAAALAAALTLGFPAAHAQAVVGEGHGTPPTQVRDASLLKPPAGHPVAILELEDLECPACAHDFSTVRAAATQYKIPLLRHDFPLAMHAWSREAAITARYLEDKVSPAAAENFRKDVFANQANIGSKDDLANFTQKWFAAHKQYGNQPFVIDPTGRFAAEVQADSTFGDLRRAPGPRRQHSTASHDLAVSSSTQRSKGPITIRNLYSREPVSNHNFNEVHPCYYFA